MKKKLLLFFCLLLPFLSMQAQSFYVSPTKYDYSGAAKQITAGCTTDYERLRAIYRWICQNISYDTSYSIYTADGCWENRRGVCQAYSELFHYMAKSLGIRTDIITGVARSFNGGGGDHAWIYAETDRYNHRGILIDPTWGSGNVNGGIFERNDEEYSWIWFGVNPKIMIYTHYPTDSNYQLLDRPVTRSEFDNMPGVKPHFAEVVEVPMMNKLRVGQTYRFSFRKRDSRRLALICGKEFVTEDQWTQRNGVFTVDYTVVQADNLGIAYYDDKRNTYHYSIIYPLLSPTTQDLRNLEQKRPMDMPEVQRLNGYDAEALRMLEVDGRKLLADVRAGRVTSLPTFYTNAREVLRVVEMPMNGVLRVGQTYTFRIRTRANTEWALVNGSQWHRDWTVSADGREAMLTVTLTESGGLCLYSRESNGGGSYQGCVEYKVR